MISSVKDLLEVWEDTNNKFFISKDEISLLIGEIRAVYQELMQFS